MISSILKYLGIIAFVVIAFYLVRAYNLHQTLSQSQLTPQTKQAIAYLQGYDRQHPEQSHVPGVAITKINTTGVYGYKLEPAVDDNIGVKTTVDSDQGVVPLNGINNRPVVVLGGSDGGIDFLDAVALAKAGHVVYALYYFGENTGDKELASVNVDFFAKAYKYIVDDLKFEYRSPSMGSEFVNAAGQPKVDLLGVSKGAELALALANFYPQYISKLALISPSAFHWQGLDYSNGNGDQPSWVGFGLENNYLRFNGFFASAKMFLNYAIGKPLNVYELYSTTLSHLGEQARQYLIPTANIKVPTLIMAGGEDKIWPSVVMGRIIKQELGNNAQLIVYPKAGHLFFGPVVLNNIMLGGDPQANTEALTSHLRELTNFFQDKLN